MRKILFIFLLPIFLDTIFVRVIDLRCALISIFLEHRGALLIARFLFSEGSVSMYKDINLNLMINVRKLGEPTMFYVISSAIIHSVVVVELTSRYLARNEGKNRVYAPILARYSFNSSALLTSLVKSRT